MTAVRSNPVDARWRTPGCAWSKNLCSFLTVVFEQGVGWFPASNRYVTGILMRHLRLHRCQETVRNMKYPDAAVHAAHREYYGMSVVFKAEDSRTKAERGGLRGLLFNSRWMATLRVTFSTTAGCSETARPPVRQRRPIDSVALAGPAWSRNTPASPFRLMQLR